MTPNLYRIIILSAALGFSAMAVLANTRGGVRLLWLVWALASALFVGLGVADWRSQSSRETPLSAYIVGGILPPLICVIVIRFLADKGQYPFVQWASGAAVFYVSYIAALIFCGYILAA
jgi:hypothetical protein